MQEQSGGNVVQIIPANQYSIARIDELRAALEAASSPIEVREIEAKIAAIESYMKQTGLYSTAEIRPVNESLMLARWKLGRLLRTYERGHGPGRGGKDVKAVNTFFRDLLKQCGLTPPIAMQAQRIGTMPEPDLQKAFEAARAQDILTTYAALIHRARPYWYQINREDRHSDIAAAASGQLEHLGPFPLIYADPPWKFETYSAKGLEHTPDQHYPTLSDDEIKAFKVGGKSISEIAHKQAALFLWCTSSNLERALAILKAWDFQFKASAVWIKGGPPTQGLIFRNRHELLLYGTRGAMPGPQYQPPSVFEYPRGAHSAKPPEIRAEIERMYPDFSAATRLELFTRNRNEGWTGFGFESNGAAIAQNGA